ncbi:MAG: bifunctional diaminohydroxyphosphoribosylaminopyrimidine deaminase/5-amino-6-(5-phosphoribosylamino)uracil reductase RibD [Herpetosiphonaceae bacterium]|nr:bifunctional diaminohydroxyphosphoribosylaminopyrimidine deaminase/5-amino-6-(5-phosphoribosylamino)uracil reductase RibD [Herpetosiphonaceae bacterium]
MQSALDQATFALGRTSPNPPVGAVVVQAGAIVGRGWTQPPGGPHAEIVALQSAGELARGADLYVTLEPCTIHGRTPPCTEAIIAAGVRRVFIASRDPNPRFERDAATVLAAAGVEVAFDPAAEPIAIQQTEAFRRWITTRRPFVIVKYAMTLDGKIAARTNDARWVTGPIARQAVHELRDRTDAILVGVGTVLADDPLLTTRIDNHWRPVRHPLRIILDSRGRTPLSAAMLQPDVPGRTLIATTAASTPEWRAALDPHEVLLLPTNDEGRVDLHTLLIELGQRDITSLLVEGGSEIIAGFVETRMIDKLLTFIAPKIVGGAGAPSPVGGAGVARMADAAQFALRSVEQLGADLLLTVYPLRDEG